MHARKDLIRSFGFHAHRRPTASGSHQPDRRGQHRQQVTDQERIRIGRVAQFVRKLALPDQGQTQQSGQHEDEHGQDLDEPREERSDPCMGLVLGSQDALHDGLVRAPVLHADDRVAEIFDVPADVAQIDHRLGGRPGLR